MQYCAARGAEDDGSVHEQKSSGVTRSGVSVVVVAFHRPTALGRLLQRFSSSDAEVVVVAVEADPYVAETAERYGAVVVRLDGNPGFAAAVNQGVQAAAGDVVVLLNDDVRVDADALVGMAHRAMALDAVIVPALRTPEGDLEPSIFALPTPGTLLVEWALTPDIAPPWLRGLQLEKWRRPVRPVKVAAAAATAVACPKHVLEQHPLPIEYFLYWEEAEWFWRLREAAVDVWYDPATFVEHAGGRDDVRPQKSALLARNAVRCVHRTQGRRAALLAWPVVVLWNLRLVLSAIVLRQRASNGTWLVRSRLAGLKAAVNAWAEVR